MSFFQKTAVMILCLVSFQTIWSQHQIQGQVKDNLGPIAFANVVLKNIEKSSDLKGTVSNETGHFKFESVSSGNYQLQISFMGFETYRDTLEIKQNSTLSPIILKPQTQNLNEVVVTYQKPKIEKKVDRLVFQVANTSLTTGNAWDIIKNTPGIMLHQDQISIRNSRNIVVLLNEKRIHLSGTELKNLLEGTSGDKITAIEVITNPPAKYEADGNAILHIKTKTNIIAGYKGNIRANYTQSIYPKWLWGTSHYFTNKKINTYLSYNISKRKNNRLEEEVINFNNENDPKRFHSFLDRNSKYTSHNIRWNTTFNITPKQQFTLSSNASILPNWTANNQTRSTVFQNELFSSSFNTKNKAKDKTNTISLDGDYDLKLKQGKLTLNAHYTNYDTQEQQQVNTDFFDLNLAPTHQKNFRTRNTQTTDIFSSRIDFSQNFKTEAKLESGLKFANINTQSNLKHYDQLNQQYTLNTQKTNAYNYHEKNMAAYLSFEHHWNKLQYKIGLRAEYTDVSGFSPTLNLSNNNNYTNWFPTLYLQYPFNDQHQLGITYGKRISRPNYSALNPFKFYFSDYSFFEGNPNLQPTIHHKFDIQYTLMQKFNFSLFYNHAVNEMVEVNFQDNVENTLRFTNINAPKNDTYGLSFNTSFQITPDWNTTLSADYYYDADQFYAPDETLQKNKVWQYYVYANTNYQWLKDKSLTTELSFYAVSAGVQGPMNISATQDLSLGIQKKMLHDNLTLSLRWNDILNTQITTIATSYLDQQNYFIDNRETQSFQLGLRYRFGNQKLKQKSNKNQNAEQQRL